MLEDQIQDQVILTQNSLKIKMIREEGGPKEMNLDKGITVGQCRHLVGKTSAINQAR